MKFTILLLAVGVMNIWANVSYSQSAKISLHLKNASVEDVLNEIENNSGYYFLFNQKLVNVSRKVNINVNNMPIKDVLSKLFINENVEYQVYDKQIILAPKEIFRTTFSIKQLVTGTITDVTTNGPIPGVYIVVEGTSVGTISDFNGNFSLDVPKDSVVLTFSYIGYVTKKVLFTGQKEINVSLEPDMNEMDEVVVIGYGAVKKSDLTGSVVSLKSDAITTTPVTNALESLQGKVSGLDITRSSGEAGASMNFTIRGNRSLNASNTPLILVDGVSYGTYLDINPNDIESIEVLKDASSTAIYGSRGANGVIIITTKQGNKGKTTVEFNSYVGYNLLTDYQKLGNTAYYADVTREAYRNAGRWSSTADDKDIFGSGSYDNIMANINTDWVDLMIHNGKVQNYHVAVSGGNEKTSFRISSEYFNEQGLLKNDNLDRFVQHINLNHKITENFQIGTSLTFNHSIQNRRNTSFWNLLKLLPYGEPYNEDGSIKQNPWPSSVDLNPLFDESSNNYENKTTSSRVFWVGYADWNIIKGLTFHTNFALDLNYSKQGIFEGVLSTHYTGNSGRSRAQIIDLEKKEWTWENTLTYTKDLELHSFTFMLGNTVNKAKTVSFSAQGYDQAFESSSFYNLGSNSVDLSEESNLIESQLASFFGRFNYKLMDRYLLTLSLRADGSSVLADGNKWAYFPSAAVAWRIKQESFLSDVEKLSDLKLRASYGVSGNSAIDPYQTQGGVSKVAFAFNETAAFGYLPTTIANKELGWEKTTTLDIGLDFGFFDNRIAGSVDIYQTKTSDLLMESITPAATGYTSVISNIGKTETKGVDVLITTTNITTKNFTWTTDINFSSSKDEIVELSIGGDDKENDWFVGHPINVFYDYEKTGIWQTEEEAVAASYGYTPGQIKVKDQNEDGVFTADDDRVILGQQDPKWTGGVTNTFTYKNISLSVLIYARIGQMISCDYLGYWYPNGIYSVPVVNYWTPENPTNEYPRPSLSTDLYLSTLKYIDGSFWKIKDIRLSYSINKGNIAKLPVSNITLYATAKNFFTFSKVKDYDPERGGSTDYPLTKQIVFGLNISL